MQTEPCRLRYQRGDRLVPVEFLHRPETRDVTSKKRRTPSQPLPSLDGEPVLEECLLGQWLGESICHLVSGGNGMHCDVLSHMGPEEVVPHIDVLGPGTILRVVGNLDGATVVLENPAMNLGSSGGHWVAQMFHFLEDPDDGQSVLEGTGHADIFCFSGRESNDGLQLGGPKDWHPTIEQDITMPGLCSGRIGGSNFFVPVASKVSIHIKIQGVTGVRL